MQRILALDVGEKRIGVAVSDSLGLTAQGVETIQVRGEQRDRARVLELARQYGTDRLLAGLPRSMDGTEGFQAQRVRAFVAGLQEAGLSVRFWDERLTTRLVTHTLLEGDVSRQKRKQVVDKLAAVCILQGFLDAGGWRMERPKVQIEGNRFKKGKGVEHMDNQMEQDNIIELVDENEQTVRFEHLMTVEHEGDAYVLLVPVDPVEDVGEDEVVILRIEPDEEGDDTYVGIEDEELLEAVFEKYLAMAEAEEDGDSEDGDD